MKTNKLGIALTFVNLGILIFLIISVNWHSAAADDVTPVVRTKKLEIIDDQGKVRAHIVVNPPSTGPDGKKYEGGALLRLIDPNGRPAVKLGGSAGGSGMSLAGDSEKREWNGIQILADEGGSTIILTNKDGRVQTIKP